MSHVHLVTSSPGLGGTVVVLTLEQASQVIHALQAAMAGDLPPGGLEVELRGGSHVGVGCPKDQWGRPV